MAGKGKRRANAEGTIYKRKDGRYEAALTVYSSEGPKRRRSYHHTRAEADKWLTKAKAERDGGVALEGDNPTLTNYLQTWLAESVAGNVMPATYESYESNVRLHISPALGHFRLRDLRPKHIQSLYAKKRDEGLAPRTRTYIHQTLNKALNQAARWGEIPSNPAALVERPKEVATDSEGEGAEEIHALTDAQAYQLFEAARGDRFENLFVVAVRTGLREGELLGLKWEDLSLDVDPAVLTLRRSLAERKGGGTYFTPTKRKSSRRKLALLPEAADALRAQSRFITAGKERLGEGWEDNDLVFPNTKGSPMNRHNLYRRHFKPLLERARLPDIRFHDLRHTFATIMLYEWEVSPGIVQEMLGHGSIKVTMDFYSHVMPSTQEAEIRRISRLYQRGANGTLPSEEDRSERGAG